MKTLILTLSVLTLSLISCGKNGVDIEETAQQVGDVMASIDEAGGSSGTISYNDKSLERLAPKSFLEFLEEKTIPSALAATCASNTFGSCSSSQKVRNFDGRTIGLASFQGTVT